MTTGSQGKATADFDEASKHLAGGDLDEALAAFARAHERDPQRAPVHVMRAAAWLRKGERARAAADCDAANVLAPNEAAYRHPRGNLRRAGRRFGRHARFRCGDRFDASYDRLMSVAASSGFSSVTSRQRKPISTAQCASIRMSRTCTKCAPSRGVPRATLPGALAEWRPGRLRTRTELFMHERAVSGWQRRSDAKVYCGRGSTAETTKVWSSPSWPLIDTYSPGENLCAPKR